MVGGGLLRWDFNPRYDRFGSFATDLLWSPGAVMSATLLKADMAPQSNTVRRMFALLLTEEYDHV